MIFVPTQTPLEETMGALDTAVRYLHGIPADSRAAENLTFTDEELRRIDEFAVESGITP